MKRYASTVALVIALASGSAFAGDKMVTDSPKGPSGGKQRYDTIGKRVQIVDESGKVVATFNRITYKNGRIRGLNYHENEFRGYNHDKDGDGIDDVSDPRP